MRRAPIAVALAVLGAVAIVIAKTFLEWTHPIDPLSYPKRGALEDIQFSTQYWPAPWPVQYARWGSWTLLASAATLATLAHAATGARSVLRLCALAASLGAAVVTAAAMRNLPGATGNTFGHGEPQFQGSGPGGWVAIGGFLLLGVSAAVAPARRQPAAQPPPPARVAATVGLVTVGGGLAYAALELRSWYDTHGRDWTYPFLFRDVAGYLTYGHRGYLERSFLGLGWSASVLPAVLVVLALARPRGAAALRWVAGVLALLAPVAVMGVLAYEFRDGGSPSGPDASDNPFHQLESAYWFYAAGCLLLALAALAAPPRRQRTAPLAHDQLGSVAP